MNIGALQGRRFGVAATFCLLGFLLYAGGWLASMPLSSVENAGPPEGLADALRPGAEAMRWEQIKAVVASGQVQRLGRNPQQRAEYRAWRADLLTRFASVADFLRDKLFGYGLHKDEDGRLVSNPPPAGSARVLWRPNDFPYHFEPGVEHHILWCERGQPTDEMVDAAIARERQGWETVSWVNPVGLQSVRGLDHAHVLSFRSQAQPTTRSRDGALIDPVPSK